MKKLCCVIIIATGLWGCGPSPVNNGQGMRGSLKTAVTMVADEEDATEMQDIFSLKDAEKILGEPASLTKSSINIEADTTISNSTYTAKSKDEKTGKTGNVYFMHEQYNDAATAHGLLAYYQKANEQNGAKTITGMGDEAWYHTDGQNFYFIMARKGNKMIRLKVNKVTANTSVDAFNAVAKEVVERM
jgi:hypothetical protein